MEAKAAEREIFHHLKIENLNSKKNLDVLLIGSEESPFASLLRKTDWKIHFSSFSGIEKNEADRYDIVIANNCWNSLNDDQLEDALSKICNVLKPNGIATFRQDMSNGTRTIAFYTQAFDAVRVPVENGTANGFKLVIGRSISATVHAKQRWDDWFWIFRKSNFNHEANSISFRQFLDQHQYTDAGILMYEFIFGKNFISPGGAEKNFEINSQLKLKPGDKVLDIGCGIAGNIFQMAEFYGVEALGADLSSNMLSHAVKEANVLKNTRVNFQICDVTEFDFEPNQFDVIYSRDCIIHIADKKHLFRQFFKWLKPGGQLLFTDYNVGEKEFSPAFKAYLADRQYALAPIRVYVEALKAAGFANAESVDLTEDFAKTLVKELKFTEDHKAEFLKKFSKEEFEHLTQGWKNKMEYIAAGDHKWGLFRATKAE